MRKKIIASLANILSSPFVWGIDRLVEVWRRDLSMYQERRANAGSSLYWRFWTHTSENARQIVNLWDGIREQRNRTKFRPPTEG